MRRLLVICLILSSCRTGDKSKKFDGEWFFYETIPGEEPYACLPKKDVIKLRELLLECGNGK